MIWTMLILFPQTCILLVRKLCCRSLKTTKQWSRLSSREEARQWDMFPEPTELRLTGYLTESTWTPKPTSNMLTPETNSRTNWQRTFSHVMSGFVFVQYQHFQLCEPSLKQCRKGYRKKKEKNNFGKVEGDAEPGFANCSKLSCCAEFECIKPSGILRASGQSLRFNSQCRETSSWRFKSEWLSVEFSSLAIRCKDERKCEETRCCRNKPEPGFSSQFGSQETKWKTSMWILDMGNVCVCRPECSSSHGKGLLGEVTFYQKSATTNSETNVRCDKNVGQRAEKFKVHPWSTGKTILGKGQTCFQNPRINLDPKI